MAWGVLRTGLTPSFCSRVLLSLLTQGPGVVTPMAASQKVRVPAPVCGRNGLMGAFLPPTCDQVVTVQEKIWFSCVGVSVLGASVVAGVAQSTASPASDTNATPPEANGGSLDPRGRAELAQLSHRNLPSLVVVNCASCLMPADEPLGRAKEAQVALGVIESPCAPLTGL